MVKKAFIWRTLERVRWPLLVTTALYGAAYAIAALVFDVLVEPLRVVFDILALNLVAGLVYVASRRRWAFVAFMVLLIGAFFVGSAAKIALLGRPVMPDDAYSVVALVRIMGWLGWLVVALPLVLMTALFFGNLDFRRRQAQVALAALVAVPLLLGAVAPRALRAADSIIGNHPWDQRENFTMRGPTLHILQETLRAFASRNPAPTRNDVAAAIARLERASEPASRLVVPVVIPATFPIGRRRNVHILLEESFWDPTPLLAPDRTEPLLDPRFYALWDETGRSTALSPTFSGGTANAEFELLCGFPVDSWAVKFEQGFNTAPCLPALLRDQGYRAIASHPNDAGFWNRLNAYPRLGFESFWSKSDFLLDEMIVWMLADRSLYRQVAEKIAAMQDDRPVLDFIVTLYGHWTYDMVPERPAVVPVDPDRPELGRYATMMHYKSIELMDEIGRLRASDPDALIIAFGDHLPNLGYNWGEYKNNGFFTGGWGDFSPEMYARSRATPLLVIDGRNGPLRLGSLPLYRLNQLVLERLGIDVPNIGALLPPPSGITVRPVPDTTIAIDADGRAFLCQPPVAEDACGPVAAWLADVKLLAHDIFEGDGHALGMLSSRAGQMTARLK